jgi:tRNA 2-selenouridine synthase
LAIEKVHIDKFLELSSDYPVLDVRSPAEYKYAHIPDAISFPLFTDEERKVIGTAYKQQSRQEAIKIGLDEQAEAIANSKPRTLLVHCWRGGMRSAAVAWLLDLYGFKVYTLSGGYKKFRHWVLDTFTLPLQLYILGGFTGAGKTKVLKELEKHGETVIDLESLANHKGSAFGNIGMPQQPSQEMFENMLASKLREGFDELGTSGIWLEDESQRIGQVNIPQQLWQIMRSSPIYFLDIGFEERLNYLEKEYGVLDKQRMAEAIERIRKRLGGLETKTSIQLLDENRIRDSFEILLKYYDKCYNKGLNQRDNLDNLLNKISADRVDAAVNAKKILKAKTESWESSAQKL